MGIVLSKIIHNSLQSYDKRHIRELHTDHLGRKHSFSLTVPGNIDVKANMQKRVPHINDLLKRWELSEIIKIIESGGTLPTLEFVTKQEVLGALSEAELLRDDEIAKATSAKTYLSEEILSG